MRRFRRHNMAEGFVSSHAFGRELVEHRPRRSLVLPYLQFLSSSITDLLRSLLKASLLHLEALKWWIFDRLLRLLVFISRLLIGLPSWADKFGHVHTITDTGMRYSFFSDGRVSVKILVTPKKGNLFFSGNNEGRLDDDSWSKYVKLNGGIVEPELRADETPGPRTTISRGIFGLDSFVESFIEQWLRHQDVNLDSLKTIFENFNVEDLLMTDPLFNTVLTQKTNNVCMDLLRMLETNSELRSEELKEYYPPICWNSTKRLEFFCRLSDRLLLKARAPNQQDQLKVSLVKELESKNPPILGGQWNDKIDPNFRADSGNSSQCQYNYKSVVDLLRFIRNNWHHCLELPEEFKLKFTGHGVRNASMTTSMNDSRIS